MAVVKSNDILGTGRRKTSVARVRIRPGEGKIHINSRELEQYFNDHAAAERRAWLRWSRPAGAAQFDVIIRVDGGGITGQADACKLGIARALKKFDEQLADGLRDSGLLTRDGRMKERKKYGLRGARRGTQFSKR